MQKIKKPVSILLSLIMVLGLFTIVPFSAGAAAVSGTDGNITWTFDDETGTLTISGAGDMNDYTAGNTPWYTYKDNIHTAVIEEGVTSVGNNAFYSMGLKEISLPDSLKSIGDYAIGKTEIESITIPESVETIGEYAFDGWSLKKITVSGTPKLAEGALDTWYTIWIIFEKSMVFDYQSLDYLRYTDIVVLPAGCSYIKNGETIPLTVENRREVFNDATVSIPPDEDENTTWSFDEETGVLTISGTGDMMNYSNNGVLPISETEAKVITSAPWGAFGKDIKSVIIEEGVTSVGDYAFYSIEDESLGSMLTSVQLPSTLKRIGESAFENCMELTEISLPEGLESLGDGAFYYCEKLSEVLLPDNLESIGDSVFAGCKALESLTLPTRLKTIGYSAFKGCGLKEITIPESVVNIGSGAFQYAESLKKATILGTPSFDGNANFYMVAPGFTLIFKKAVRYGSQALYFGVSDVTVIVPYGSKYNNTLMTPDNASEVFRNVNVVFTLPVAGHSISLNGDIALNFYLSVPENTVLHFEWYNKTYDHTVTADDYDAASGYYKVQVNVAAAEMNCPITASCTVNNIEFNAFDVYSVRQYADVILDSESDFSTDYIAENGAKKYDVLVDLIKKMLDYGAKAQTRFGVTDAALANDGVDYTMQPVTIYHIDTQKSDMTADLHKYGIDYIGTSIVFLSQTTLRHYYVISDDKLFEKVKDTANFTFVDKGQRICFELKDIPAAQLDVAKAFTLGDSVYRYSVLDYCKLVIADENKPQSDRELAMATYWYNDAAKAYFYANDEYEDDMV